MIDALRCHFAIEAESRHPGSEADRPVNPKDSTIGEKSRQSFDKKIVWCNHIVMNTYYVYIITNKSNSTLYVGVTNNLERWLFEHKNKLVDGFSKRYNLTKLLYFEETSNINSAIEREKQIKAYSRLKKESLIFYQNPTKKDRRKIGNKKRDNNLSLFFNFTPAI